MHTLDLTLKIRLAHEVLARQTSFRRTTEDWLAENREYLGELRSVYELTVEQLAEVLLEAAYVWTDGPTYSAVAMTALLLRIERRQRCGRLAA